MKGNKFKFNVFIIINNEVTTRPKKIIKPSSSHRQLWRPKSDRETMTSPWRTTATTCTTWRFMLDWGCEGLRGTLSGGGKHSAPVAPAAGVGDVLLVRCCWRRVAGVVCCSWRGVVAAVLIFLHSGRSSINYCFGI